MIEKFQSSYLVVAEFFQKRQLPREVPHNMVVAIITIVLFLRRVVEKKKGILGRVFKGN